jgi:hypothetical protein
MSTFNVEEFDERVCNVVSNIHNRSREDRNRRKFNKWYRENITYLNKLYEIAEAELDLDFDEFCYYIFVNSNI